MTACEMDDETDRTTCQEENGFPTLRSAVRERAPNSTHNMGHVDHNPVLTVPELRANHWMVL